MSKKKRHSIVSSIFLKEELHVNPPSPRKQKLFTYSKFVVMYFFFIDLTYQKLARIKDPCTI